DINRSAFLNGNIAMLKANAALEIPEPADISRVNAESAEATFNQRWQTGTQRFDARAGEPLAIAGQDASANVPEPAATALPAAAETENHELLPSDAATAPLAPAADIGVIPVALVNSRQVARNDSDSIAAPARHSANLQLQAP